MTPDKPQKQKVSNDEMLVRGMKGFLKAMVQKWPELTIKYLREMGIDIHVIDTPK